jgi:hypothetical protein
LREELRLKVFENRVLRSIFGSKRGDVAGEWGKIHTKELHDLFCSPNIARLRKWRMRWAGHLARRGRGEVHAGFWWGKLREREYLEIKG